ncbi:TPA: hypothetical protein PNM84_001354 [Listeria monocytogenes]|nr:hypothetical protein [Listeria monocytogenes]HAA9071033.1 hypothetical protein [Listeria monocytogenes]HDI4828586.1 hypothetical protein [Listeria monocytogenes]HDM9928167.1 hypothetical protein [Listeria monocytogenes]
MNQKIKELLPSILTEKNISFLIGAGASTPFFSSLGNFEKFLTSDSIDEDGKKIIKLLFYNLSVANNMHLIEYLNNEEISHEESERKMKPILFEYRRFLHNILEYLKVRNSRVSPKRANIVTTNYDLFIETAIDDILKDNPRVHFNDGTNGYTRRLLHTDNFNKTLLYSGIFDNYSNEMPTINLIKCHGSVNWLTYVSDEGKKFIEVQPQGNIIKSITHEADIILDDIGDFLFEFDYEDNFQHAIRSIDELIEHLDEEPIESIAEIINLLGSAFSDELTEINNMLDKIEIVYPTKKKFESTLVNEYYFSLLRLLSYELEKEQSSLIVFGFSFYDEHITEIVQRSLNNPNLLVIIICFTDENKDGIISNFNFTENTIPNNVKFITPNDFVVKELDIEQYKVEYNDENLTNPNIINNEEKVKIYSDEVSFISNSASERKAVLDFNSLNTILESDITNTFDAKNLSIVETNEGDANG